MESAIPEPLRDILADFQWCQGREKLELLLDYAERLPPLPEWLQGQREQMDQVHECMTPVFVYATRVDGRLQFYFDVPPESPTVRGYAAILQAGLRDTSPEQILQIPNDFYRAMGLQELLTNQRLNGIVAILAHIKRLAVEAIQHRQDAPSQPPT